MTTPSFFSPGCATGFAPLKEAWSDVLLGDDSVAPCCARQRRIAAKPRSTGCSSSSADVRVAVALEIVEALAPYKRNTKLMKRLETAVTERGDPRCSTRLERAR